MELQKYALFENLHDLGFNLTEDVPLLVYDRLVVELKKEKQSKFKNMVDYMNSHTIN